MSKVVQSGDNRMAVEGDMLVTNAVTLRHQGEALLASLSSPVTVDLSQVGAVSSAGVSVLLSWMRKSEALGKQLVVANIPEKMRDVCRVSGLDALLSQK